ncbi:MAG: DUF5916 domain-containing protein [Acidobacteriota bacterium]|nr:DUF5916 domain-containing protein [Acidobacteriota bacterium]
MRVREQGLIFTAILLSHTLIWAQNVTNTEKPLPRQIIAYHTDDPIKMDGILDEPDWQNAMAATNFIQREPYQGEPATETTEIRILYDNEAIYFGVWAWDRDPEKLIINHLEQDFSHRDDDGISFYIDTFNDDRNCYGFYINPAGAKREMQSVDEGMFQIFDWEDVWDVKTQITHEGWFAEVKIPFKSLRFSKDRIQTWGINFQRRIRRKNEQSFWAPMPRRFMAFVMSYAGDLQGLENLPREPNVKIKPFITSHLQELEGADLNSQVDLGIDLKYSLTTGLTLDGTLNTDFSQVEVDIQKINLTRFSLFFPEKRDFFLENAGIFSFGEVDFRGNSARELIPFFSRRIGLAKDGRPIPIVGGGRLTGRVGQYGLGFLNMQTRATDSEPTNNFTVARIKRNILNQSELGAIFINRQSNSSGDYNRTYGVEAKFRFWQDFRIVSFLAATQTPGMVKDNLAGRIWMEWKTNRWEARTGYFDIGENFNAEVGFVPRRNIRKGDSSAGWRFRPRKISWIREFFPNVRSQYITDHDNRLVTRITDFRFQTSFHNGAFFAVGRSTRFERLDDSFLIRNQIEVIHGDYNFSRWFAQFRSNPSATLSGKLRYETGDFWDGISEGVRLGLTLRPHYKFSTSVEMQRDNITLKYGKLSTRLLNARVEYRFNTKMFLSALIQYNSDQEQINTHLRFNLIHRPLSDIYLVYNEQRNINQQIPIDKSLSFKYTHMLDLF